MLIFFLIETQASFFVRFFFFLSFFLYKNTQIFVCDFTNTKKKNCNGISLSKMEIYYINLTFSLFTRFFTDKNSIT